MGSLVSIKLPDIGDFEDVEVIEVMVKPGDKVRVDDSLITIESDKASMEVPATETGIVKELKVKVGDRVSEGSPILVVETSDESAETDKPAEAAQPAPSRQTPAPAPSEAKAPNAPPKLESVPPRVVAVTPAAERPKLAASANVIPIDTGAESQTTGRKPHASPVGAQVRARTRCRSRAGQGHRLEWPHLPQRRPGVRQEFDGAREARGRIDAVRARAVAEG